MFRTQKSITLLAYLHLLAAVLNLGFGGQHDISQTLPLHRFHRFAVDGYLQPRTNKIDASTKKHARTTQDSKMVYLPAQRLRRKQPTCAFSAVLL